MISGLPSEASSPKCLKHTFASAAASNATEEVQSKPPSRESSATRSARSPSAESESKRLKRSAKGDGKKDSNDSGVDGHSIAMISIEDAKMGDAAVADADLFSDTQYREDLQAVLAKAEIPFAAFVEAAAKGQNLLSEKVEALMAISPEPDGKTNNAEERNYSLGR